MKFKNFLFIFFIFLFIQNIFLTIGETNKVTLTSFGNPTNVEFFYDLEDNSKVLKVKPKRVADFTDKRYKDKYKWINDENSGSFSNWLSADECILTWDNQNQILKANFEIDGYNQGHSSFKNIEKNLVNYLKTQHPKGNDILEKNLWMNVEIYYSETEFINFKINDTGITKEAILKKIKTISSNLAIQNFLKNNAGKTVSFTVKLNEPKCSNNGDENYNLEIKLNFLKVKIRRFNDVEVADDFNENDNLKIGLNEDGNLSFQNEILNLETLTNDNFSLNDIALISHNFKKFKTKNQVESFLNEIIKNLNLFDGSLEKGKTLWVYFDKTKYPTFEKLKNYLNSEGYENFIIKDLDPIIGFDGIDDDDFENEIILIEDTPAKKTS